MTSGNLGSEPLIPTDFTFAYRFYEAETQQPWPETNAIDPPRPPNDGWRRKKGPETPWREWKVGRNLTEGEVIPRRAYSIVWRKSQQAYWILPANCVSWQEQSANPAEGWHRLQFHNLAEDTPRRRGLWKVVEYGLRMEHGSICPPDFKEFLPGHFFSDNGSPTPCHLVGDLSLVLGMLAMVPRSPLLIVRQIDKYFYYENSPRYIPTTKHKQWYPMSRDGKPYIPLLYWKRH